MVQKPSLLVASIHDNSSSLSSLKFLLPGTKINLALTNSGILHRIFLGLSDAQNLIFLVFYICPDLFYLIVIA